MQEGDYVDNSEIIDNNYYEIGFGLAYDITDKFVFSAGYLLAHTGVSENYQSDLSFSLSSGTIGGGFGYKITDNLMVNLGVGYSMYKEGTKTYDHLFQAEKTYIPVTDTYYKDNLLLGLGLDINF
jgi:long-subunit fatty acid transport protein